MRTRPLNDRANGNQTIPRIASGRLLHGAALVLSVLLLHALAPALPGQSLASAALPDAPMPQTSPAVPPTLGACQLRSLGGAASTAAAAAAFTAAGLPAPAVAPARAAIPCPLYVPIVNWYTRFSDGPKVKPLTPSEKAWLAIRNVSDPFNAITILGTSGISIASDPDSPYGPGMPGFGRLVGVSYAAGHDRRVLRHLPHSLHRPPGPPLPPRARRTIPHRILHAIVQVAWTQGDNGRGMLNYADLVGFAIDDEISNLYVPGRKPTCPPAPPATPPASPSRPRTTSSPSSCPTSPAASTSASSSSSASSTRSPNPALQSASRALTPYATTHSPRVGLAIHPAQAPI